MMGAANLRGADAAKPVLLYTRYFNAAGETRYLPEGTYKDILGLLRKDFDVRANSEPVTSKALQGVSVVLIANPSDEGVGTNPPPHHISATDSAVLARYVNRGGGLMVMGNQENHNLEIKNVNGLLGQFGIQFTNLYTDAKLLPVPKSAPIIGGMRWAYYTGNLCLLNTNHAAKPRGVVSNDLTIKPLGGQRDQDGVLMALAEPGQGRVLVVTDSGWMGNSALSGEGIGGIAMKEHDNGEICARLLKWLAHKGAPAKP